MSNFFKCDCKNSIFFILPDKGIMKCYTCKKEHNIKEVLGIKDSPKKKVEKAKKKENVYTDDKTIKLPYTNDTIAEVPAENNHDPEKWKEKIDDV